MVLETVTVEIRSVAVRELRQVLSRAEVRTRLPWERSRRCSRPELHRNMKLFVVTERRRLIGLDNAGDFDGEPLLLSDGADPVQRASYRNWFVAIERVDPPLRIEATRPWKSDRQR